MSTLSRPAPAWVYCIFSIPFWVLAVAMNSVFFATLAALFSTLAGVRWLYFSLGNARESTSLLQVGAVSLLAILGSGWLIALVAQSVGLNESISDYLNSSFSLEVSDYSLACLYSTLFSLSLALFSRIRMLKEREALLSSRLTSLHEWKASHLAVTLFIFVSIEFILLSSGVIGYRTVLINGVASEKLVWYAPLLDFFYAAHIGVNGVAISGIIRKRLRSVYFRLGSLVSVLFVLFIYFSKGRSALVEAVFIQFSITCLIAGWRPSLGRVMLGIIFCMPVLYYASLLNNFMRGDAFQFEKKALSILEISSRASSAFFSDRNAELNERQRSLDNVSERPLLAYALALCIKLPLDSKSFAYGENVLNSVAWTAPSIIFGAKDGYLVEEDLIFPKFAISQLLVRGAFTDLPNSPYFDSYIDFGWLGVVLYPAGLFLIWILSLSMMRLASWQPLVVLFFFSFWLQQFTLGIGESNVIGWLVGLRNQLLFIPFIWIFSKLLAGLVKRRPVSHAV